MNEAFLSRGTGPARRATRPALTLLAFMMSVGPFGDTEYTPAMPAIARSLDTSYGMVQFTMASYLIGSALSRLAYGPLSDRFGRRPVMLVGALILVAGTLLCLLSFSIWPLIAGRLVQGVGACAGGVLSDAAVRDAFPADKREGIYARLNAAFALAPAVGPVVGVYAASKLGWHGNFGLLLALSVLLLVLVWRYLPETLARSNRQSLGARHVGSNYLQVIRSRGFLLYSVLGGLSVGVVYTALIGAPDLVYNVLKGGDVGIMIVSAAILVAFVTGAGLCELVSDKITDLWIFTAGLAVMAMGGAALLVVAVLIGKEANFAFLLAPIAFCFIGVGLIVPATTANAMAPFKDNAGTASSMLGFVQTGTAALATAGMSAISQGSIIDMPIVFLALTLTAFLLLAGYVVKSGGIAATIAAFPTPQGRHSRSS
ncbi:MAG: multidrug effflux MFS transporter [Gammaproteobacteria bacterium]|nr:multidrug effflux MFS transporter [Gammaproteobacteria bacterium]